MNEDLVVFLLFSPYFVIPLFLHWRIAEVWVASGASGLVLTSGSLLLTAAFPGPAFKDWGQFLAVAALTLMLSTPWSGLFGLLFVHSRRNQEAEDRYLAADPHNHRDMVVSLGAVAIGIVCVWAFFPGKANPKAMLGYVALLGLGVATLLDWAPRSSLATAKHRRLLRDFADTFPLPADGEEPEHRRARHAARRRRVRFLATALLVAIIAGVIFSRTYDPLEFACVAGPLGVLAVVARFTWKQGRHPGPALRLAPESWRELSSGQVTVRSPHDESIGEQDAMQEAPVDALPEHAWHRGPRGS